MLTLLPLLSVSYFLQLLRTAYRFLALCYCLCRPSSCLSQGSSSQSAQQGKFCSKTSQCPVHSSSAIPHVVPFFPFSRNTRFWFSLLVWIPCCLGLSSHFVCSWWTEDVRQQASQKLLKKVRAFDEEVVKGRGSLHKLHMGSHACNFRFQLLLHSVFNVQASKSA